jgi:hypothetical protein
MRLYGAISKVEPQDDGTVRVHGIATTEATDDQGEIVRAAAMRAAIPDYMKFPALREMHQLSAAGTTLEAECDDDGITRIVAHVVDPVAITKVKNKVYRGFSIGGRVTQREAGAPKNITGLVLNEISLVDRPANPEAIFDCWKAAAMTTETFNPPVQIWACGVADHRHLNKAEALKCLEKRAAAGADTAQAEVDAALAAVANGERVATDTTIAIAKHAPGGEQGSDAQVTLASAAVASVAGPGPSTAVLEAMAAARQALDAGAALLKGETRDAANDGAMAETAKDGGDDDMAETAKDGDQPYGDVEYADPGYQSDGKKRYPLDSEKHVRAAWSYINMPKNAKVYSAEQLAHIKGKIKAAGKKFDIEFSDDGNKAAHAALTKALWDIGFVAEVVLALDHLQDMLEMESEMEGDDSPQPARLKAIITELCGFLNALVAEETAEILNDTEIDPDQPGMGMGPVAMSAIAGSLRKTIADTGKLETLMTQLEKAGARHNKVDQAHLDTAAFAISKAIGVGTAKRAEMAAMADAHKAVLDSGATNLGADGREMLTDGNPTQGAGSATQNSTTDTGRNARSAVPNPTGAVPVTPVPGMAKAADAGDLIARIEEMAKSGKGHLPLLKAAHDLLAECCDGATCKEGAAKPGRINAGDMAMMHKCHGHLMAVDGVECAAAANELPGGAPAGEGESQGAATTAGGAGSDRGEPGKDAASANEDLAKALTDERAEKDALVKTLGEIVPMMSAMQKRIEEIAQTPLPAATVAMPAATDAARAAAAAANTGPSSEDIVKALADMPEDQRVQTLIKAQYRRPIRISRFENAMTQREMAKQAGQS